MNMSNIDIKNSLKKAAREMAKSIIDETNREVTEKKMRIAIRDLVKTYGIDYAIAEMMIRENKTFNEATAEFNSMDEELDDVE